jgi:predicted acylesterase/phospholipase RssA
MKWIIFSTIFTIINQIYSQTTGKCYVLGMEGGGDKGAYQTGVFKGLVDNLPANERAWNVISGISAGSINAFVVASTSVGNETQASDFLLGNWRKITGYKELYQNWWGGVVEGFFSKSGLYDTSPLHTLLEGYTNGMTLQRDFVIGATNMYTGMFDDFTSDTLQPSEYVDSILASGAYPVIFPNRQFRNETYMDGGVKVSIDLPTSVNKCRSKGYKDSDIVVDVLLNSVKTIDKLSPIGDHPLDVLFRVFDIYGYDETMRDLEEMSRIYPDVYVRYVVAPSQVLPSGSVPLNFDPTQIEEMIQIGIKDGENAVKSGEGVLWKQMKEKYLQEKMKKWTGKTLSTSQVEKANADLYANKKSEEKNVKFLNQ